jgi:hypothetical protein
MLPPTLLPREVGRLLGVVIRRKEHIDVNILLPNHPSKVVVCDVLQMGLDLLWTLCCVLCHWIIQVKIRLEIVDELGG